MFRRIPLRRLLCCMGGVRLIVVCGVLCLAWSAHAQPDPLIETLRFYGDSCFGESDEVQGFTRTSDGGYALCGHTQRFSPGTTQIWLVRVDSIGNLLWEHGYGGPSAYGSAVVETADGGLAVAGIGITSSYMSAFSLLKVNASGDQVWLRLYDQIPLAMAFGLVRASDGGFVLSGNAIYETSDACLMKADADGNFVWSQHYDVNGGGETGFKLDLTSDGGFVISGHHAQPGSDEDLFVVRTDSVGDTLWQRVYPRPDDQYEGEIRALTDGGFAVTGTTYWGNNKIFLTHLDGDGNITWWQTIGEADSVQGGRALLPLNDGYMLAGESSPAGFGPTFVYLARTDLNGTVIWHRTMRLRDAASAVGVTLKGDRSLVLAGWACCAPNGPRLPPDGFLVITGPDSATSANPLRTVLPRRYALSAYPNPFNGTCTLTFSLLSTARVSVGVYDIVGRKIVGLANDVFATGDHRLYFDGTGLPSGVYLCQLKAGELVQTKKMVLMK